VGVSLKRAVFLDRDGVINKAIVREGRPHPPASVGETVLAEGAEESLARLRQRGFMLVLITNQPDVGRGMASRESVEEIHRFLFSKLALDDIFVCYHDDKDNCACRKPEPGLILEAATKYSIDIARSYLIGDRWRDIEAGNTAGCRTVFIDHRYNERGPATEPDIRVQSLCEATDRIVEEVKEN
jgi:D-glycero-D-manno-heptose 1,7-bisphosphate phosphatase